ncbi:hypothetical protein ACFPN2_38040 [Steroidobacter flavus]|uniref:Uncharacterized protein n=1 Tax=Steroidobacter flavus TaxID=1842136 RepID=A0ABV8T4T2_9GAMM
MTELAEGLDGMEIELLDLGDATIETKQSGIYAFVYDSIYVLGERVG